MSPQHCFQAFRHCLKFYFFYFWQCPRADQQATHAFPTIFVESSACQLQQTCTQCSTGSGKTCVVLDRLRKCAQVASLPEPKISNGPVLPSQGYLILAYPMQACFWHAFLWKNNFNNKSCYQDFFKRHFFREIKIFSKHLNLLKKWLFKKWEQVPLATKEIIEIKTLPYMKCQILVIVFTFQINLSFKVKKEIKEIKLFLLDVLISQIEKIF